MLSFCKFSLFVYFQIKKKKKDIQTPKRKKKKLVSLPKEKVPKNILREMGSTFLVSLGDQKPKLKFFRSI